MQGCFRYAKDTPHAEMIDSSAGINAAAAQAIEAGERFTLAGTYRIDEPVTVDESADLSMARFVCNDPDIDPAVRIGTTAPGQNVYSVAVQLPTVINECQTPGGGWSAESVGVELSNLITSIVYPREIRGFGTGLRLSAYGAGTYGNLVQGGYLNNNRQNIRFAPGDLTGYVNSNTVDKTRCAHKGSEGFHIPGARHVLIDHPLGGKKCNGNWLRDIMAEGDVPEYHLECFGAENLFTWWRWEAHPPRVKWSQRSATDVANGNRIDLGRYAGIIDVAEDPDVYGNVIDPLNCERIVTGGRAQNNSDSPPTPSTHDYSVAMDVTVPLGPGRWTVVAHGSALMTHSAGANTDLNLDLDGATGTARLQAASIALPGTRVMTTAEWTGVSGGSKTLRLVYKSPANAPGTTGADQPWLSFTAVRTA